MSGLEVIPFESLSGVESLCAQWLALLRRCPTATVFQSHEWATVWLHRIGRNRRPLVLVARDSSGQTRGIAPLMVTDEPPAPRLVQFIGAPNSDYGDFLIGPGDGQPVMAAFFRHLLNSRRRTWDRIWLQELPETSATPGLLRAMCSRPAFPGVVSPGESCPTLVLAGREQEVGAQLAAKKYIGKRDLRRSLAHVESLGRLRFYRCRSLEEARAALPHLFRMHRQRWHEVQESKFSDPAYEALYEDLLTALWPRNGVAVTVMELDQRPIAISFAFPHGSTWTNHTWIHDQEYRRLSPGSLLIQFMIYDAIRSGYGEFDFTRGAEWYKGRFANDVRRNSDLVVYSRLRDYLATRSVERWTDAKSALAGRNPKLHRGLVTAKRALVAPLRRPGASGSAR